MLHLERPPKSPKNSEKRRLDDLFRAEDVFSPNRPTPVTWD